MAIRGVSFEVPAGRHRHHPGRQRRGQDHGAEDRVRRHGPAEGHASSFEGREIQRHGPDRVMRLGISHVPEGREVFPFLSRAREPAHGRLHAPRRRRRRPGPRDGVRLLPGAARARRAARRLAVGRRAADAGDQPRADGAAEADAARRALARAVAQAGEGDLRDHRAHQPRARRDHAAGRAERQHGAADRRLRLRAGGRPHRDGRHLRAAAREGGHQGVLPRHEGSERRAASGAGRGRRHGDDEPHDDGARPGGRPISRRPATRCPSCSGTWCSERGDRVAMREKDLGIWRAITGASTASAPSASARAWSRSASSRGDVVSILADNCPEWLYTDLGTMCVGGVTNGIYTDRLGQRRSSTSSTTAARRFLFVENEEQLDKILEVRERCPRPRQDLRLRHGGPARLPRRAGDAVRRAARARRARYDASIPSAWEQLVASSRGRGPGDPRLHLGHHRAAQGRDADPPQHPLPARATPTFITELARRATSSSPSCRSATSPSAPSRSSLRCAPAPSSTSPRASTRCRRTSARWRPRIVLRRAAHLGEASTPASPSA